MPDTFLLIPRAGEERNRTLTNALVSANDLYTKCMAMKPGEKETHLLASLAPNIDFVAIGVRLIATKKTGFILFHWSMGKLVVICIFKDPAID